MNENSKQEAMFETVRQEIVLAVTNTLDNLQDQNWPSTLIDRWRTELLALSGAKS